VYCWASWRPDRTTRETCPDLVGVPIIMHWDTLEPKDGDFQFEEQLGQKLRLLEKNDFYSMLSIWVGPTAPKWIYGKGVPMVQCETTINPKREKRDGKFPHYLDEDYINYFHRLVSEFGKYIKALPPELRKRIVFVQSAEGSTDDGQPYKGAPLEEKYRITKEEWAQFRLDTWKEYQQALADTGIAIMVNDDSDRSMGRSWMLENFTAIGFKQGMFSHGYHISDVAERIESWKTFSAEAEAKGRFVFTRGEQDAEWKICGWSSQNPKQALYWSGLFATYTGLDVWNLPAEACEGNTYADAIHFFNKYAGQRNPATSPAAFCALRRGLDASDTREYPESKFGKASKKNVDRYLKVAEAYSPYGAKQGDPEKATGGGMENRQRDDYNDVGWGIVRGNYWRFLEQVDPEQTSMGWWHKGPKEHIFSRFARGFDHENKKTEMRFRLNEPFFANPSKTQQVKVRVAWLDEGRGKWELEYHNGKSPATAFTIQNMGSSEWKEKEVVLKGAVFSHRLPEKSDLILKYISGDDTAFHILELDRMEY
jgi:hypothetical protein